MQEQLPRSGAFTLNIFLCKAAVGWAVKPNIISARSKLLGFAVLSPTYVNNIIRETGVKLYILQLKLKPYLFMQHTTHHLVARLHQIHKTHSHTRQTRHGYRKRQRIIGLKNITQQAFDLLHHVLKCRIRELVTACFFHLLLKSGNSRQILIASRCVVVMPCVGFMANHAPIQL